jgi:FHA domain
MSRVYKIGRNPSNELSVSTDYGHISGHHADIIFENDGTVVIQAANDRNGTTVNGSRIRTSALKKGDDVRLADYPLQELLYGIENLPNDVRLFFEVPLKGMTKATPPKPAPQLLTSMPANNCWLSEMEEKRLIDVFQKYKSDKLGIQKAQNQKTTLIRGAFTVVPPITIYLLSQFFIQDAATKGLVSGIGLALGSAVGLFFTGNASTVTSEKIERLTQKFRTEYICSVGGCTYGHLHDYELDYFKKTKGVCPCGKKKAC